MLKTCRQCGYVGIEFRPQHGTCKSCANEKARVRMEEYRKTDGYKQWLIDSREQRRTLKEKYRRQKGSQSIDKIRKKHDSHVHAYEKQLAKAEALKGKALDHSAHVDCWRALTDSERARLKHANVPEYAIYHRVKRWMHKHLGNGLPSRKWSVILGYTPEELKTHLEKQFVKGMTWNNKGDWHIDHIIPVSAFSFTSIDDADFKAAYSLPNLRPLWAKDNMRKGKRIESLL